MSEYIFEIRRASQSDLRAIAGVHLLSWRTAYAGVIPASLLDFDPTDSATIENSVRGWATTFQSYPENLSVAVNDSETVLGFCCAGPVDDAPKNAPYQFQIYGLHVRPQDHRHGIGTALLRQALNRATTLGMGTIVWTLRDLAQSRRFYERQGGKLEKSGMWELAGHRLEEVAYGWGC
jgi:ribosomal protein S18 acetylase RimI-like enzyme